MLFWGIFYAYVMRITFILALVYLKESPTAEEAHVAQEECCECPTAFIDNQVRY